MSLGFFRFLDGALVVGGFSCSLFSLSFLDVSSVLLFSWYLFGGRHLTGLGLHVGLEVRRTASSNNQEGPADVIQRIHRMLLEDCTVRYCSIRTVLEYRRYRYGGMYVYRSCRSQADARAVCPTTSLNSRRALRALRAASASSPTNFSHTDRQISHFSRVSSFTFSVNLLVLRRETTLFYYH